MATPHGGDSPEPSSSGGGEREKVYVAMGKEPKGMLLWVLHKFPQDAAFVLLHVYSHLKFLPTLGARIPTRQVEEQELIARKKMKYIAKNTCSYAHKKRSACFMPIFSF